MSDLYWVKRGISKTSSDWLVGPKWDTCWCLHRGSTRDTSRQWWLTIPHRRTSRMEGRWQQISTCTSTLIATMLEGLTRLRGKIYQGDPRVAVQHSPVLLPPSMRLSSFMLRNIDLASFLTSSYCFRGRGRESKGWKKEHLCIHELKLTWDPVLRTQWRGTWTRWGDQRATPRTTGMSKRRGFGPGVNVWVHVCVSEWVELVVELVNLIGRSIDCLELHLLDHLKRGDLKKVVS